MQSLANHLVFLKECVGVKVKLSLCFIKHHLMKTKGNGDTAPHTFLISALDGIVWSALCPGRLNFEETATIG
jgi:hypothetical protein